MTRASRTPERGFSLIDVLLVIVLLGVMAGALMTLSGRLAVQSAEALRTRQALAIAQGLLDEVRHMPFTYCDPDDVNARTATSAVVGAGITRCAALVDVMGAEPGESRYNAAPNRFDGVTDYQNFQMPVPGGVCAGICDIAGNLLSGAGSSLAGCTARVMLTPQALAGIPALDANGRPQVLRIGVTVTCPSVQPLLLEGIRVRHAPNWF